MGAHGGSQPSSGSSGSSSSFRAGSIMTGHPRYQQPPISTVGSGMASSNLSVNRSSSLTAPASVRGSSVGSAGAPQSTQPSSNPPPGHGPPSSARFYHARCKFCRKYKNGNIDALSFVYSMLIVEKYCVC